MAVLMVGLRVGDRALPLVWLAEEGPVQDQFRGPEIRCWSGWLPNEACVLLSVDRFYPSVAFCSPGWMPSGRTTG